ncbi:long-chain fatty acid--CoA ligase [Bdellovibrio bacteriovorus]|uniref:Long-chain-fatty-acid--CoA ligase n=1 Tax=Bdellovibrio bacteriovorus TaxID=959 RepID=A0A150WTQ4_BDEBC|nr:AMP-binding protein [Bdellovibrio bacteriovorus]KYG69833.1 long-chain fatty acid--CoA ligase [Bdellovibrio bacteriovorus]
MEKIWLKHYPKGVSPEVDVTKYSSLFDLYEESIRMFSQKKAFTNMGVSLTFSELDRQVQIFASFLQNELKLKKGDRIAIQMPNVLQFPIIAFAALRSGLTIVNTNPLYTAKEMQHQFKDSGAKAVVILANYASQLEQILKDTQIESVVITEIGDLFPTPKRILVNSVVKYIKKMVPAYNLPQAYTFRQALELGAMKPSQKVASTLDDIAFLQYTGGTTGVAKGAMLLHRNVLANVLQIRDWMKPKLREGEEIAIAALPLYHIFALTLNCLGLLRYGAENILITNPRDIPAFIKEMKKSPFTVLAGVNTLFNALMNNPAFTTIDFSKVKISVAGAMTLQKPVAEKWMELTKSVIVEGYGLTEASPVVCCNPIDGTDIVGTIGLPFPSTEIKLLNDDDQEVAPGEPGELVCKGPQVMAGYWNKPEETEKVLKDGWLRTGDVATVDEKGFFKIVDRKKDMILVSGFNVYPNEVEEAIASHPGVLEVAAIGVPDEHSGEIVKAVVVKKDPNLTAEEVIAHARKTLTGYKTPRLVEFRTELPKTNVGKILRRALRDTVKA